MSRYFSMDHLGFLGEAVAVVGNIGRVPCLWLEGFYGFGLNIMLAVFVTFILLFRYSIGRLQNKKRSTCNGEGVNLVVVAAFNSFVSPHGI